MRYPEKWIYEEHQSSGDINFLVLFGPTKEKLTEIVLAVQKKEKGTTLESAGKQYFESLKQKMDPEAFKGLPPILIEKEGKILLENDIVAYRVIYSRYDIYDNFTGKVIRTYVEKNDLMYSIGTTDLLGVASFERPPVIYNQILSTFRFIK